MYYYKLIFLQLIFSFTNGYHTKLSNGNIYDISTQKTGIQDNSTESIEKIKINIKVYYETHCPASVTFFRTQLRPVVEKLGSYLDVHLIPYGHARTLKVRGRYHFRCQHGPEECYGNKLHACTVDALQNNTRAVMFNACLMQFSGYRSENNNAFILSMCGYILNLPINDISECINSERSSLLLKGYGEETRLLRPKYVPYVIIEDPAYGQFQLTNDLKATVCRIFHQVPPPCSRI
ncbi:gamma-interferon-inducible lysosomal thiol reductase-like [Galleria mellonella]|uniref:Gamma-interferon-inducible lysosomal thiol reductase-like n=1 Tax=Galleria mellonella TaxID=7137 RepID=A0A6J1WST0_GALME|nr:gamma-interferon-inducible lysosomal thiol reductase-like [Galleria mellonella]